jgi:alpha,alpha-trehalose phosphorylase
MPRLVTPSSYVDATEDVEFEEEVGLLILVETARLWRGLGHHDAEGRFRIDGVTGPDEYDALVDNNVYTNLMAEQNQAASTAGR